MPKIPIRIPKLPVKAEKPKENEEDYEIVAFEDIGDKPASSKSDLLTLNDNINYRLCYEANKTLKFAPEAGSSKEQLKQETSLGGAKNVAFRKLSGSFMPFVKASGKSERGPLFSGVIPKPKTEEDDKVGEHRYQRFSDRRTIFRRIWEFFPGLGSTALAIGIVFALAVGVWWVVCGALGTSWGEHHYRKLWEHTHPSTTTQNPDPFHVELITERPTKQTPVTEPPTNPFTIRYHDHNNLSTKNKNPSADTSKKTEASKKTEVPKKAEVPRKKTPYAHVEIPRVEKFEPMHPLKLQEICANVSDLNRFDCAPNGGPTVCKERGCCWRETKTPGAPYCFYPPQYKTFKFDSMTVSKNGMQILYKRWQPSGYPGDWKSAMVDIRYYSNWMLEIKVYDPDNKRWEVPVPQPPTVEPGTGHRQYVVTVSQDGIGFKIRRTGYPITIIDMQDVGAWILSEQLLQVSIKVPEFASLYGFGEHRAPLERDLTTWNTHTIFNRDTPPAPNMNLYGTIPFYWVVEDGGEAHGILFHNSNAMDVVFQPTPALTYRSTGGILDMFIFLGPYARDVTRQLTDVIGRPHIPPYWALGFHLCKYGYKDLNYTRHIWERNRDAGFPFDVQWNDIDYMKDSNDFTIDESRYADLPKFVDDVHAAGMHYVMLFDPGVSAAEKPGTYPPYDKGIEMDVFIKNSRDKPFIGKVWNPIATAYPDFTHPNATPYWLELMSDFHQRVKFDGAWIDMNEPSNFLNGEKDFGCEAEDLPYKPQFVPDSGLKTKTVCMDAKHYIGSHYNVHNLYALYEAQVTNFALQEIRGKRPFIISRASYPGLGHYAGHWSGDIASTWEDLRLTIPSILLFNVIGVPLVGADICGFGGRTSPELCKRWMQLGAFYPFARNHADNHQPDHDPAAFAPDILEAMKKMMIIRYTLLPYYYTLFWRAHVDGETVVRPLFYEWDGYNTLYGIDDKFLIGKHVMIAPILTENVTSERHFFPGPYKFYRFTDGRYITSGEYFYVSDDEIVSIRSGGIIPLQAPPPSGPVTTTVCRPRPLQLVACYRQIEHEDNYAKGELYWDDGDSINSYEEKKYTHIEFLLKDDILQSFVNWWGYGVPPVNNITILAVDPIAWVTLNDKPINYLYNNYTRVMSVVNINLSLDKPFKLKWSYLTQEEYNRRVQFNISCAGRPECSVKY